MNHMTTFVLSFILTLIILGNIYVDDNVKRFIIFLRKRETFFMKAQSLLSGKKERKNINLSAYSAQMML